MCFSMYEVFNFRAAGHTVVPFLGFNFFFSYLFHVHKQIYLLQVPWFALRGVKFVHYSILDASVVVIEGEA